MHAAVRFFGNNCFTGGLHRPGGQPIHKPAVPAGDDHHGGERAAPRPDHQRHRGRHGGGSPRQSVTLQYDHSLVQTTVLITLTNTLLTLDFCSI